MSRKSSWEKQFFTAKGSISNNDRESSAADDTFTASDYLVGNTIDNIEEMLKLVRENTENRVKDNSLVTLSPDRESSEDERSLNESSISQLLKPVNAFERRTSKKNGDDRPATVPLKSRSTSGVHDFQSNIRHRALLKKIEDKTNKNLSNVSIRRQVQQAEQLKPFNNLKGPIRVETSRMILRRPNADIVIEDCIELIGCGERNKRDRLQKLIPTVHTYNSQDTQAIRPSSIQSVSVGNNYVLIERILVLKQLQMLYSKSKRFEEKRSFRSQRRPRGKSTLGRIAKSESELDKDTIFNLCGQLEVVSTQQTIANSSHEYVVLDSIELRADGSTAQPQQELIPFKGEVKQPPRGETKMSACKYDEHIYIGQNVILMQRDIRVPSSESYYAKPFSFLDSRSYSTDKTVNTLPTNSDKEQHSCLPRLSDCNTAISPADSTAKSPTNSTAKSPDSTARSPTYGTAKSQRSFGSLSPVSPRVDELPILEDALPKDEGPIQLFSVISKSKKGTAKGTIRDFELIRPGSIIRSDERRDEDVLRSSAFSSDSNCHKPPLVGSPLKVNVSTPPNEALSSARENQTGPLIRSAPQTPPLELGRIDKVLPEVSKSENSSIRTASSPSERSPPTRFSTGTEAIIPECSTVRSMKKRHRRKSCVTSADAEMGASSASCKRKGVMVKDGQQLKPILLKHLYDLRKRKAILRSLPLMNEELTIPSGANFPMEKCSSEDASKDMEELSQDTVKEDKESSKGGKGIKYDDKQFNKDNLLHRWKKHTRSVPQQTSVCHVLVNKETNSQRVRSRSAEPSKVACLTSTETAKTLSAESLLSLRKNHQREMLPISKQMQQECTPELLKTARQVSEVSLKTTQQPKRDLPKEGSKRNGTLLNIAEDDDGTTAGQLRWSTMKSKSQSMREEMKEHERFLEAPQEHRKLRKVPTNKSVEQKPPLNREQDEKIFRRARGSNNASRRYQKKPLSLESCLGNEHTDETIRKTNRISKKEWKHTKSNEEAMLKTARENSIKEIKRILHMKGLEVSKKDFDEELLKTAREVSQLSSKSSSSSTIRQHNVSGSYDRMKKPNKRDKQKERKFQYGKKTSEKAIRANTMKLPSIEKEKITHIKDRRISSATNFGYTKSKYDNDELQTVYATTTPKREMLKKDKIFKQKTSHLSRRNAEISTIREDEHLNTARSISPKRSSLKTARISRTKERILNNGDEIVIEATDPHNVKISLNITIRMKISDEQLEHATYTLTPNRIFIAGREVYTNRKHL